MYLKQLQQFQLLFLGGSIGFSMLLTYLFGLVLGLSLFISAYIGIIVYIRKTQPKALKSLGLSDSDTRTSGRHYANSTISCGGTKPTYICLFCGRKVSGRVCHKCGSHMIRQYSNYTSRKLTAHNTIGCLPNYIMRPNNRQL